MNGSREDHPTPAGARPSCTGGIKRTNQPINQPTHVAGPGKIIPHTDRAGAPKGNTSQDLTPRRQAEPFRSTGAQRVSSDQTKVSMFPLSPRQVRAPERTTASASLPTRFSLLRCVCWLIHWLVGPRASEPPSRPLRGPQVSSTPTAEFGVQGHLGDRNALPPPQIWECRIRILHPPTADQPMETRLSGCFVHGGQGERARQPVDHTSIGTPDARSSFGLLRLAS